MSHLSINPASPLDSLPLDRILEGDCVEVLATLPDSSVDVVFADPPYNLQLGQGLTRPNQSVVDGVDADWDKFADFKAYDALTAAWLGQARRILKPNGSLWVIGSYHNIFRVGTVLQDLGYWILNDVIWLKTNPMPNFRGTRFTNAHETLIWAARSPEARPVFNYEAMKNLNDDKQMRSDWTLPLCTGAERLRGPDGTKVHPTQKPESLLYRVILASTRPGAVIVDPFFGTGTTGVVAKRLGRRFIGIERDPTYIREAERRLAGVEPCPTPSFALRVKREEPRIPFGTLVERGLVPPGTNLCDARKRFHAEVLADGTLRASGPSGEVIGSLHSVGAAVQGLPACNGWTFWCVEDKAGVLHPLDTFRRRAREDAARPSFARTTRKKGDKQENVLPLRAG